MQACLNRLVVLLAAASALGQASIAVAQPASQIIPRNTIPQGPSSAPAALRIDPQAGLETPAGAERLFVTLAAIRIEDAPSGDSPSGDRQMRAAEVALRAALAGRRVSGEAIFAAARALEAAYVNAGDVLARVVLAPQQLRDGGTLRLRVIEGYIERIETKNVPEPVRLRISRLLPPLAGRPGVTLADLERRILLAGDTPGVLLKSTLAPGSVTGAAVLVIEAVYQPVDGTFSADNTLPASIGRTQLGLGSEVNSVFGHGERLYLGVIGAPEGGGNSVFSSTARSRTLLGGVVLPLGNDGLTLTIEAVQGITTPRPTQGVQSHDDFQRLSLRLRYPWIRSRTLNLATQLAFDAEEEHQTLIRPVAQPISLDRLRVLRVTNDGDHVMRWGGVLSGTLTASFGLPGLGARGAADATTTLPLSRQGAADNFVKLDGTLNYAQSLAAHLSTSWTLRAQSSLGGALANAEQIGIAGSDALSAFDTGYLLGDSGEVLRGEVAAPYTLPFEWRHTGFLASPYVFGAIGDVFLSKPTAVEAAHVQAGAYGIGLRVGAGRAGSTSSASLDLEIGRQTRSDGKRDASRFTFVSLIRF